MTTKNIKSFALFLVFLSIPFLSSSQPWMKAEYFPEKTISQNFYEIQAAFYNYWETLEDKSARGTGLKQFKRWETRWEAHVFPTGVIPSADYYYKEKQRFIKENPIDNNKGIYDWTPLGIKSWTNGTSGYNPGNGRVNVVEVDPNNSNIIYVGTSSGGIWKSVNGGTSWNTTTDDLAVLGVSAIAVNPSNSSEILIGTGDRDSWASQSIGILRSIDGGTTWNASGMYFGQGYYNINKILYNPQNNNTVFAASSYGVHRSTDGGNNWTSVYSNNEVKDLEFKSGDTTVLYGSGARFVKSIDAGLSFAANTSSLPYDTCRIELAVTAANTSYVYVLVSNSSSTFGGVYQSTNSGTSFSLITSSPNMLGYAMDGSDDMGQGWYDLAIAASPTNANEVYIGGVNIWKTTNAGSSWSIATHWVYDQYNPQFYSHADIHYLQFFGNTLWCGSDGGVFKSTDGSSFTDLSNGLEISQFYAMGGSEIDPNMIVAGAQDNGSNLLKNGSWTHLFGADGMEALINHTNTNNLYVTYQYGGLLRSDDGGDNFYNVAPDTVGGGWITPYLMHPSASGVMYAAYRKVFKTMNGGLSWRAVSNDLASSNSIDELAVAPSDTNYIYASYNQNLFYSTDAGVNWNGVLAGASVSVTDIEVHPTNPQRLWITLSGSMGNQVKESINNGQSFVDITNNLTNTGFNAVVFDKNHHDALYVGTNSGVYYTDTTMSGLWVLHGNSLPNCDVRELEINYSSSKIRAATYGRGIWEYPLYQYVGIAELDEIVFDVYPNPAADNCIIKLEENAKNTNIDIFSIGGKQVMH
ncbi:MAG: glycosyl hydrolase, partial [Bacteroidetes bacterium]